ncbi:MAG: ADP-forming succinate--CoA ligase subunit beta [Dethiobacteria bacterium]|jgi:succinyl-CoA synthetase beta subunit|nr:ADP-forming succinate--CoA ligase subunit beta [Bacillota bacterium]
MKLLEYQGKQLFEANGIKVPRGQVVASAEEARTAAEALGGNAVLKVQVPVGGRGKAGGIKLIDSADEAPLVAEKLLNMEIKGFSVEKLLVEEKMDIAKEIYLGLIVDTDTGNIVMLFSPEGGMDIEQVAEEKPEKVFRLVIDPTSPPPFYRLRPFIRQGGFSGKLLNELTQFAYNLLRLFLERDLLVGEINPLIVLRDGRVVAGDSKVEVDDNALFRHQFEVNFWEDSDELEKEAREIGVTYVKLDGNIGVIASGAGLGMGTMDLLEEVGLAPANFLETGGGITEELMYKATKLVCKNEKVSGLIINLYGGVNPIEKGAKGIVRAIKELNPAPPVVVKALGNKQEECWETLRSGGITVVNSVRTEAAVERLVELMATQKQ